jgi:hypothetical protein
MPRRPSIHLDDVARHIVQRGHNRDPVSLLRETTKVFKTN